MFHTFLNKSKQKRFIIQAECISLAVEKMLKVDFNYSYQLSAFEPVVEMNEITAFIPTTILYSDGQIKQIII